MDTHHQPRIFPVVTELAAQVTERAAEIGDPLTELAREINAGIRGEVDSYVLLGVLVEGIAVTLAGIPSCRRQGAMLATAAMLRDRIRYRYGCDES